MRFGLRDKDIGDLESVFSQFKEIESVLIYGSRAKGNYREGSDIDLTLLGHGLNIHHLAQLELKIDELMLPYKFDISIMENISNPDLVDHIRRVGKIFYTRKDPNPH